jgi:archaetidylinositol phosphate synthase
MVLDSLRGRSDGLITSISKPFMKFNPNSISVLSLILAALCGILIYLNGFFLIGAFFALLLSALLDAVDGKVARMRNIASPVGDLVDHVIDRYSDIFILAGFIFSPYGSLPLGIAALAGVLMTSYMGTQSQALGLHRNYSGILGRADRLVFMLAFIIIQLLVPFAYHAGSVLITPTTILLIWFAVAGNITAAFRFRDAYAGLKDRPE